MLSQKKRIPPSFYSIFPPSFTTFKIQFVPSLLFGGFAGLVGLLVSFVVQLVINLIILVVILLITLVLTGNKSLITLKRIIFSSLITTLLVDISVFAMSGIFDRSKLESNTPFSYYLSLEQSALLSEIVQFLVSGIMTFILLYFFFKKLQLQRLFTVCLFVAVITLPWSLLIPSQENKNFIPLQNEAKNISPQQAEFLSKQISGMILGEEMVPDLKLSKWKQLRINISINVPQAGQYHIDFVFAPSDKFNDQFNFVLYSPDLYYINNSEPKEYYIQLTEGENKLTFDFPYINSYTNKVNLKVKGDVTSGQYGPYTFQFSVQSFSSGKDTIPLKYSSKLYTTKSYKYTDFVI